MILPPEPDLAALRLNLARLRHDRGWSFTALAERTGLSRQTVMDIEHGKTVGTQETWHAFAHAFGLSYDQLFSSMCNGHKPPHAEPDAAVGDDDR